jgi:hypothetical protein
MPLPDPAVGKDSKLKYDRDGKQPEANIPFSKVHEVIVRLARTK